MIDCLSRARLWWYHEAHHSKPTTVKTYNMALQWLSIYLTFGLDPLGQLYLCDISDKGWSIQIIHWNSVCHRWCCVSPICILEIYSRCFTEKKWLCCLTARRKFRHDEAMQLEEMTLQCNRHDAMSRVYIANTTSHKIGLLHSINQKQPVARFIDLWKWHSRNSKRVYGCRRLTWASWYIYRYAVRKLRFVKSYYACMIGFKMMKPIDGYIGHSHAGIDSLRCEYLPVDGTEHWSMNSLWTW